jgi:hypothetical protein
MGPLSDRTVISLLVATLGLVFALVFWFARLNPAVEPPLLWKEGPELPAPQRNPPAQGTVL